MDVAAAEQAGKFELVQMLAQDLSKGGLELPSFPDIVIRIRQSLANEDVTVDQIVQIIGADPVLAARILMISNSAALRPATDPITDLRMAVNRIGHNMVRNTAVSHGVSESKNGYTLKEAKVCLDKLWDECAHVASLCFVLAKKRTKLNPDEALLIGLMHGIGKLYILKRAESHPELFTNESELFQIMDDWHAAIGSSIVETWGFEQHVSDSIANYSDFDREHEDAADYTDVLTLAHIFSQFVRSESMEVQLENVPASRQLNIDTGDLMPILDESKEQIQSLRRALGK